MEGSRVSLKVLVEYVIGIFVRSPLEDLKAYKAKAEEKLHDPRENS